MELKFNHHVARESECMLQKIDFENYQTYGYNF